MYTSYHAITGEVLFNRKSLTKAEFELQYQQLARQQHGFASENVQTRTRRLLAFAQRLEQAKAELAYQICIEVGRCLRECEAEISKSIALIRYYAHLAPELLAHKTIATQASLSQVRFEPLGTVLAVMPWNYPVWQILRFAIPALCAGNACLVKPAPSVGQISQMLFDLTGNDLPLQLTWLDNDDIEYAIAHTQALAFTGSTQTGRYLAALAGRHLRKCVMELGGSNAFIVLNDADVKQAASEACYSRFRDAGQSCNAAKRLIVHNEIAEDFLAALQQHCQQLQMGEPWLPTTTLAPLHRQDLRTAVHTQVQDALAHGAQCLLGGEIPSDMPGWFYPATILDKVNPDCRVYNEEVFGPVAIILRARDNAHALKLANDNPFGLGASIYTQDAYLAWQFAEQLNVGSVFINRHTSSDLRLPFGGVKDSGFGRELSEFGIYEFVNIKTYWQK
ncbi:aldehyde dehydrogenase family protein [Snodgrassella sp. ESL0253]|uniref:aldehyde dehydrogenase family protein n=1 Tax=Snodgrassella sp. ESL0253 TaxID=2705031 RepID=UPI001583FF00|nr:aldehyde dehydrogenase family protein [Snodgrassella sp. ESL0253]NUE67065.1 aldehyde dehydrogenase family protein [Snodgrassella sp. ESL0253]